jgi:hypothetical protein
VLIWLFDMTVLAFLIPGAILGLIAWVVLGFLRSRAAEAFTLATATAFYARVVMIIGTLMSLTGLGIVFKALFGFLRLAYSYYDNVVYAGPSAPACQAIAGCGPPSGYLEQQRGQDLVLGLTLVAIGFIFALAHYYLARSLTRLPGGAPAWLARSTLLALTITTALGAIPATALGLYQLLTYFILGPSQGGTPWGDNVGAAIAFVPAWLFFMTRLIRSLRHTPPALTPYVPKPEGTS